MTLLTGLVVGILLGAGVLGQTARPGFQIVVRYEAREIPGLAPSDIAARQIHEWLLPDGGATIEYMTDGRAWRRVISHSIFGLPAGTIELSPPAGSVLYVLDPRSRTYSRATVSEPPVGSQPQEVNIRPTGKSKILLGRTVRQVAVSIQQTVFVPETGNSVDIRVAVENWCADGMKLPVSMLRKMDVAQQWLRRDTAQYRRACPVPVESVVRPSILEGFEIVVTTQSIRRLADIAPGTFEIPRGYREVQRLDGARDN